MADISKKISVLRTFVNDKFVQAYHSNNSYKKIKGDVALKEIELSELKETLATHERTNMITDEEVDILKQRLLSEEPVHRDNLRKLVLEYDEFRTCVKTYSELFSKSSLGMPFCPGCCKPFSKCPDCGFKLTKALCFAFPVDEQSFLED